MKLQLRSVVAATSGTLLDGRNAPEEVVAVTDTRTLVPGESFLALRGERFDGHDYLAEAAARGAALLVVDRPELRIDGVATLVVGDTLRAYLQMAGLARAAFAGSVLAITGSAGKTTTKAFVTRLLEVRFGDHVLATPANENNEIGVSRLLLRASNDEHRALVVEMGARHFGDVAALVDVALPDVGILTNVGDAHLEIVGSRERLAETKWALFARGAGAVLNANDGVSIERAPSLGRTPHWFAALDEGADPGSRPGRFSALIGSSRLIGFDGARTAFDRAVVTRVPGAHNRTNLAAAIAGALELGVDVDAVVAGLPDVRMPAGRFESFEMAGGWRVIYDAYNANASGSIAALDALADEGARRAIAVLSSMAELGTESIALHERVGAHAARRAGIVLVGGEFADALARGARRAGIAPDALVQVDSNAAAADWLRGHARAGDVVLLKGSRKYRMEEILEELQR